MQPPDSSETKEKNQCDNSLRAKARHGNLSAKTRERRCAIKALGALKVLSGGIAPTSRVEVG